MPRPCAGQRPARTWRGRPGRPRARQPGATCRSPPLRRGPPLRGRRRFAARVRVAQAPQLVVATDERAVEPAADRRSVRVEALQPEPALAQRRRARRVADDPPGRPVDADLLGAAARPSRSAARTDSPKTGVAPRRAAATTSPVATPQRARNPSGSSASRRRARRPRRARCASSSCATGAPKTASTASLRDSTTMPSCSAQTAARVVVALEHRAQRLRVGSARSSAQLREDARHQAPGVGRQRLRPRGRLRRRRGTSWRRIAASSARSSGDGSMPKAVDQRLIRAAVGLERLGLAPAAIEREHLLAAQPLAQRMLARRAPRARDHLGIRPQARSASIRSLSTRAADPRAARSRAARSARRDVRQRRATPQRQRLAQSRRRLPRLAGGELRPPARTSALEAVGVERARGRRSA